MDIAVASGISTIVGLIIGAIVKIGKRHVNSHQVIKDELKDNRSWHLEAKKKHMLDRKRELHKDFQYFNRRGFITTYEKTIWLEMYDEYKTNGGNSFIEDLKEDIVEMEVKD